MGRRSVWGPAVEAGGPAHRNRSPRGLETVPPAASNRLRPKAAGWRHPWTHWGRLRRPCSPQQAGPQGLRGRVWGPPGAQPCPRGGKHLGLVSRAALTCQLPDHRVLSEWDAGGTGQRAVTHKGPLSPLRPCPVMWRKLSPSPPGPGFTSCSGRAPFAGMSQRGLWEDGRQGPSSPVRPFAHPQGQEASGSRTPCHAVPASSCPARLTQTSRQPPSGRR